MENGKYATISPETVEPGDYLLLGDSNNRYIQLVRKINEDGIYSHGGFWGIEGNIIIKGPKSKNPGAVVLGEDIIKQLEDVDDIEDIEDIIAKEEKKKE